MHGEIGAYLARANAHSSVGNEFLDLRPRVIGENGHEESIEALPRGFSGNSKFHSVAGGRGQSTVRSWLCTPTLYDLLPRATHHAATLRRRGIRCGVSGVERRSQISIAIASGASTSEMNCDVDTPKMTPRGSPR